jgi:uncharacterized protein (TIGR03435 family)
MGASTRITRPALIVVGALAATTAALAGGQSPTPAFEVAVVKRTVPKPVVPFQVRPGRVVATSVRLKDLVLRAYNVKPWNLLGGPDWMSEERFDIEATFQEPATPDQVNAMLRTLLERRFRLVTRTERREMTTDAMVLETPGRLGPGLHPVRVNCDTKELMEGSGPGLFPPGQRPACGNVIVSRLIGTGTSLPPQTYSDKFAAITMERFANDVSARRGRQAYDRTGLTGQFDVGLAYVTDENAVLLANAGRAIDAPRFEIALREQLGIKLQQERNQVEQLIVTSVELPRPEEN